MLFYGTEAIIGLSASEGKYIPFVDRYLNFIPALRNSLFYSSKVFLSLFGYEAYQATATQLRLVGGGGVNLVYSCLGYGVTSFWLAFVFANNGSWKKKLAWMVGGTLLLYVINAIRISLTLLSSSKKWQFPFGWDNHDWFNIAAYGAIFLMIWCYDKSGRKREINTTKQV